MALVRETHPTARVEDDGLPEHVKAHVLIQRVAVNPGRDRHGDELAAHRAGLDAFARGNVQRTRNQRNGLRVNQQRLTVSRRGGAGLDGQRRVVGRNRVHGLERARRDDRGRDGRGKLARTVGRSRSQDGEGLQATRGRLGIRVDREHVGNGEHVASAQAGSRSGGPAIGDQRLRPGVLGCRVGDVLRSAVDQRGAAQRADGVGRGKNGFVVHEPGILADHGFFQSLLVVAVHIGALDQRGQLGRHQGAVECLASAGSVAAISEDRTGISQGRVGGRGRAGGAVEPVEGRVEGRNGSLNPFSRTACHGLQDLIRIAVKRQGAVKRPDADLVRPSLVKRDADGALGDVLREGRQVKVVVLA